MAGGHQEAVMALLKATPPELIDEFELLKVAVVARHPHLLKLFASRLKCANCLSDNVSGLLVAIREFVDEPPMPFINRLLSDVPEEVRGTLQRTLIVEAVKGDGHHAIAENMIREYKREDATARSALLFDLSNVLAMRKIPHRFFEIEVPIDDKVFAGFADDFAHSPDYCIRCVVFLLQRVMTKVFAAYYVLCQQKQLDWWWVMKKRNSNNRWLS